MTDDTATKILAAQQACAPRSFLKEAGLDRLSFAEVAQVLTEDEPPYRELWQSAVEMGYRLRQLEERG